MKLRLVVLVLASLTVLFIQGCSEEKKNDQIPQQAKEIPPLPVEVITVNKESVPIWLEYTGKTEATKRIEVRARVAGRLENVLFTEGDLVEKDQKLFEIEKYSYEAALDQAKAKLERDQASLELAKADVKRYIPLVEKGLAPRATLEQYEARKNELIATIKADEATIREAELNLSYTEVTAPISGKISRLHVDVGNIVGYGEKTLLTTIVADDPMYAYFNPTEEEFQIMRQYRATENMEARVRVSGAKEKMIKRSLFKGHVDFGDNRVDRMTGTITMRAVVGNADHTLLEGTFVYVDVFVTDKGSFFMVPPSVVMEDQRGSFVYLADGNNRAVRADIKRGFEGRYFLIVPEGIEDGDRVIVSALPKLKPDIKVAPQDVTDSKGVMAVMKANDLIPAE